ncbi:MAG: carbon-nitrogen hydrolase family protein [Dehalococcoidia bacterium]|nr:carbon-nitrogen hydrolase family protein [Dehalococcoidia bacterium]
MTDTFRVAILQLAATALASHEAALAEALRRIDDAARDEPDLIVLPEGTYPAHFLGDRDAVLRTSWHADADVLRALSERARMHRCYLATGLVLRDSSARLLNAAVLFAPDGMEVARASEATPASWFMLGEGPVAANPRAIPAALVAGADLLDPRWGTPMAQAGTRLIISTGAPRGWARGDRAASPADVVLPARAAETGAWIVSAGRAGHEDAVETYTGGAGVVTPDGEWAVRAPADRPGIVVHTLDIDAAHPRATTAPTTAPSDAPETASIARVRAASVALDPMPSTVDLMEAVRSLVRAATAQGASVVVLPDLAGADPRAVSKTETLPLIEALAAQAGIAIIVALTEREDGLTYKTVFAVEGGRTAGSHRASVLSERERAAGFTAGDTLPPVVGAGGLRLGLMAGDEGLVPTVASSLRDRGATLLAWCAGHQDGPTEAVARTRAWEQRVPVVVAGSARTGGFVVASGGHLLGASPEGAPGIAVTEVETRAG